MTRTVILGGSGFIGSHLCDRFLAKGHEVIAIDNLCTGHTRNIAHLRDRDDFTFIEADICEPLTIDGPVDNILNFASPASPKDFATMPLEILIVGSRGQHNALELAREKGARILFASTSEVYGDPKVNPQPESYFGNVNPIGIRGVYDESKRFGESITMAYHRKYDLQTRIVRIFNTYGPRMQPGDGRVLPNFVAQALDNTNITIYGDGKQTRSFQYVSDLVDGVEKLLESDCVEPVNIGNPDEITILQFAEEVIAEVGSKSKLAYRELPPGDPLVRQPVITRAKERLNWEPNVTRADGLRRTIEYFRELLQANAEAK
jgi:dTDP-glucose 4,6-dehydratase